MLFISQLLNPTSIPSLLLHMVLAYPKHSSLQSHFLGENTFLSAFPRSGGSLFPCTCWRLQAAAWHSHPSRAAGTQPCPPMPMPPLPPLAGTAELQVVCTSSYIRSCEHWWALLQNVHSGHVSPHTPAKLLLCGICSINTDKNLVLAFQVYIYKGQKKRHNDSLINVCHSSWR